MRTPPAKGGAARGMTVSGEPTAPTVDAAHTDDQVAPSPDYSETPSAALVAVPARRLGLETDESYPAVARLNDRWRVINCRDDLQWILQKRNGDQWHSNSYHVTRTGLLERIVSRCG